MYQYGFAELVDRLVHGEPERVCRTLVDAELILNYK